MYKNYVPITGSRSLDAQDEDGGSGGAEYAADNSTASTSNKLVASCPPPMSARHKHKSSKKTATPTPATTTTITDEDET